MVSSQASTSASAAASNASALNTTIPSSPVARSRLECMPKLLYGTAWKTDYTSDLVILALTHGFRGIDTAGQRKHYREDHVGQALHAAQTEMNLDRRDIWLQTKFTPRSGQDWTHPELIPFSYDDAVEVQVRKSVAASLRNLHPWLTFEPFDKVAQKIEQNFKNCKNEEFDAGVEYGDKQTVYAFLAAGMGLPGLKVTVLSGTNDERHMVEAVTAVEEACKEGTWKKGELDRIRRIVYGE
uniref:NADP-dependent oxidoreductase domain-containing protein n=1 Tax=Melanopsichium pennsylvanicum 4 TaxID=1398559 RepID=A0A077R8M9_9BASI|nr:conserved hypothetical protein [Melanopsichium pennsylvanicum 4]